MHDESQLNRLREAGVRARIRVYRIGLHGEYAADVVVRSQTETVIYDTPAFGVPGAKARARQDAETWCEQNGFAFDVA